jgi:hypothetical protein
VSMINSCAYRTVVARCVLPTMLAALCTNAFAAEPPKAGPIKVAPDHRHFADAQGKPFFWLADTAWSMVVKQTPEQANTYLENRAKKGFTVVQTVLAWGNGTGSETATPQANTAGAKVWLNDDPSTPNEAYFTHVDALLKNAASKGLVMALLPTWGYYVNDSTILNVANARTYGRWLGKRYRLTPNLVWVNGGDRPATGHEDVWRALAQGLAEGDEGRHMITYHPCGLRSSSQYFHDDKWLSFNMIETYTYWTQVYATVSTDVHLLPSKPVVMGEGAYEGGNYPTAFISPLLARRQAWWTVMAGGYHTYGHGKVWSMETGWEEALNAPGAAQMGIMREIVTALPWTTMVPDQGVFSSGVGSEGTLNTAIRTPDGKTALVYLSSRNPVFLHMDHIATKNVKVTFINPATGKRRDPQTFPTGNVNGKRFSDPLVQPFTLPQQWEDAVLLLEGVP